MEDTAVEPIQLREDGPRAQTIPGAGLIRPFAIGPGEVGLVAFDLNEVWVVGATTSPLRAMVGSAGRPPLARAWALGEGVVIEEDPAVSGRRVWMLDSLRPGRVEDEASGWIEGEIEVVGSGLDFDVDGVPELVVNEGEALYGVEELGPDTDLRHAAWSLPGRWITGGGDFDGDGRSELVVRSESGGDSVVMGWEGEQARLVAAHGQPYDFDRDGVLDLISEDEGVVRWWRGPVEGTRELEELPVLWRFEDNDWLYLDVVGDVDGDDAPDLLCMHLEGGRHWLRGSTSGERWLLSDVTFWETGVGAGGFLVLVGVSGTGEDAPIFVLTAEDIW